MVRVLPKIDIGNTSSKTAGMRVTTKGQVTIPQGIREYLGIAPNTEVDFVVQDDRVLLVTKASPRKKSKFARVVGILNQKWTTDGLLKLTRG